MSSMTRVNYVAQQRLDLHHLLAADSYAAFDLRTIISSFTGDKAYILSGFEVIGRTGLAITINVKDALTFNPLDGNGSFYKGLPADADFVLELPAQQENVFVEASFVNVTANPVNTAQWDAMALTGADVAGSEFSSSINSQVMIKLVISANTIGFTTGAIPILRASTDGSNVTKMTDCRDMLYRLGSGGVTPNPAKRFGWGNQRVEPVYSGTGVGNESNSPFRSKDSSGVLNDKAISTLKAWIDAAMTRFCEISGSSLWYVTDPAPNNPIYGFVTGLDIQKVFLDNESGHSVNPSKNVSLKWTRQDPTIPHNPVTNKYILASEGQDGLDDVSVVRWQSNYAGVTWELGGTFLNNVAGGSRVYTASRFVSPAPANNGNIYLFLERDVVPPLANGNAVSWADNSAFNAYDQTKSVSGVTGDFTGISVGDWIKKASEGYSQYYRVVSLSDGVAVRAATGDVADGSVVAVELDRPITTGASTEEMLYFRSRYSQADLVADTTENVHAYADVNFYWIGRRVDDLFILRGYGNLQEGEETYVKDDATNVGVGGGTSDIMLQHEKDAVYSTTNGYTARGGTPSVLLTIKKRKRDNTDFFPDATPSDNSGASLEYTIKAPVGLMNVGDGLWVRLSDTTSGELVNGSCVIHSDDIQNLDSVTNRWQVLSAHDNPLRNFDNKDVHLLARRVVLQDGVTPALLFADGTILDPYGQCFDEYMHVTNDARFEDEVYLGKKTPASVLFVDQTNVALDGDPTDAKGRIDEDNANFNYDKLGQEFNLFNNTFGVNYHQLRSPTDQEIFRNLGAHTLKIGGALSTVVLPGDLVVLGTQTISNTENIVTLDKLMTLGVGNLLYGGGGSGVEVADNTLKATTLQTYVGQAYVDVTVSPDPVYQINQTVGMISTQEIANITAGEFSELYAIKATAVNAGEMQSLGGGVYRAVTKGVADASSIFTYTTANSPLSLFDVLSSVKLSGSDGDNAFMTSWSFGVKRNPNSASTIKAVVTPYESSVMAEDFKTIPTARQASFHRTRIPFAWKDGVGAASSDTTFDFSENLTWDFDTDTFRVEGTFKMAGDILPDEDNMFNIGSPSLRWKTVHAAQSGMYVHADDVNYSYMLAHYNGAVADITTNGTTRFTINVNGDDQLRLLPNGRGGYAMFGDGNANESFAFGNNITGSDQTAVRLLPTYSGATNTGIHIKPFSMTVVPVGATYSAIKVSQPVSYIAGAITSSDAMLIEDSSFAALTYGVRSLLSNAADKWFVYGEGDAHSYFGGSVGIGSNNQTHLNSYRMVIGTAADTTESAGILIGGDVELFRSAPNFLKTNDNFVVAQTSKLTQQVVVGSGSQMYSSYLTLAGVIPDASSDVVGVDAKLTANASHTSSITSFLSRAATADFMSPTTVSDVIGYRFAQPTLGAYASIDRISGFRSDDINVTPGQSAAAFRGYISKGSKKWNISVEGDASNYFAGSVGIGNAMQSQIEAQRLLIGTTADVTPDKGMSFGVDVNLYRSAANVLRTDDSFSVGSAAYVSEFLNFLAYTGVNLPPDPSGTSISLFSKDSVIWQRESDGNTIALTNTQGNVYEEEVDVVLAPAGNNQMAAIVANPLGTTIVLPKDRIFLIGNNLVAKTVSAGSGVVTIKKNAHGLSSGNVVTVAASNDIDGITAPQMTGSFLVSVIDVNSFTINTAGSAILGDVYGYADRVQTVKTRSYLVDQQELEMYLNDVLQRRGVDWGEVGTANTQSNIVKIYREINLKDRVTWRIDSNGGQTMIGGGSGGSGIASLQAAYNGGSSIAVTTGVPMSLIGSGTLLDVAGSARFTKTLTNSVQYTPVAISPIASGYYGLWVSTAGDLMYHNDAVDIKLNAPQVETVVTSGTNGSGVPLVQGTPVTSGADGTLQLIDVSLDASARAALGVVLDASVAPSAECSVVFNGLAEGMGAAFDFGDEVYVDKSKALSNVKPTIGVGGFLAGDWIVKVGVVKRNKTNALIKDLMVNVIVVGKL